MFVDSKYSKLLTVLLIIVIIGIVGLLGFLGYEMYTKYFLEEDTAKYMEENFNTNNVTTVQENVATGDFNELLNFVNQSPTETTESTESGNQKKTFKGFEVVGAIEIPKTNVDLPILKDMGPKAMNTAVVQQYGPGPNQVGDTVIAGHNYRNGQFFSNNYKLEIGDTIYITDNSGTRLRYVIYNKYETKPEDADYMDRDTGGKPEISLTTCTDDSKARIIIWAKLAE